MSPIPFEIEHLDPRLRIYYESKSDSVISYLKKYFPDHNEQFAAGFVTGFGVALGHIIEDLNNASMAASFDSIVDKLQ